MPHWSSSSASLIANIHSILYLSPHLCLSRFICDLSCQLHNIGPFDVEDYIATAPSPIPYCNEKYIYSALYNMTLNLSING
ncbi:hypothetical protein BJV82DRAFT_660642, partial [Fennellomyces sp. T-0311]